MQTNFNFEWDQYLDDENSEELNANVEPVFDKSFSIKIKSKCCFCCLSKQQHSLNSLEKKSFY